MKNPLDRKMVPCPAYEDDGNGLCCADGDLCIEYVPCESGFMVNEQMAQYASRLKAICEQFLFDAKVERELRVRAEEVMNKLASLNRLCHSCPARKQCQAMSPQWCNASSGEEMDAECKRATLAWARGEE